MPATVVLVHGAFCGSWIYWRLIAALEERGIEAVVSDLPTCQATDTRSISEQTSTTSVTSSREPADPWCSSGARTAGE